MPMNFTMPVRLFTGCGCVSEHKEEFRKLGKKCLIVTGGRSAAACGALKDVEAALSELGIEYTLFDRVRSNPKVSGCAEAGRQASDFGADFVIGIGGGSAMDSAKAAAVFAANPGLEEAGFYAKDWKLPPLRIALVGTTSGTGSEVTKVSVLMDSSGRKHSIHDELLFAAVSFGDPVYTSFMPRSVTLSTGIDVLAHCAESWFSRKADAVSRAMAAKGIAMLADPLSAAAENRELTGKDREQLYEASVIGGLAISGTGTCFPHTFGYLFTERFQIPHGFASVIFFPELLEHARSCEPELTEAFFRDTGRSETELTGLVDAVFPERNSYKSKVTPELLEAVLPGWEKNGSVKNTVGAVSADEIRRWFSRRQEF